MRTAFVETLCELAAKDERIWLLTGDLGFSVLERFAQQFPERFVNVGVAEQNMTGMAAGLAMCGKTVFTYSIANFPVMRCLEQIRNDVCYHQANVKIVAVGGGFSYGAQGYTHHAIEDLAVMRAMPNMTVVAPGDITEVRLATRAVTEYTGPCYLRLGKGGEPEIYGDEPEFRLGKAILLRTGGDVALIATGAILAEAYQAAEILNKSGIHTALVSMHTLKPLDTEVITQAARQSKLIVTVEEHSSIGGLREAVAAVLAGMPRATARLISPAPASSLGLDSGSQSYLRAKCGLDGASLAAFIAKELAEEA
jgi:transketolase